LRKAAEWEQYNKALPSFKGVMPKFDNKRQRFLAREECVVLLNALKVEEPSLNWHDIALFAVNTGLRRGEIFNLKVSDVNFSARIVAIMDTKAGKNRTVKLNDVALSVALKKASLTQGHENLFQERAPKVFNRAIRDSGLNDGITDLRSKVTFHTLRHTFASWLVQAGYPIALISQMLGHSSINVTMRYAHLSPSQERQAVEFISQKIRFFVISSGFKDIVYRSSE
jgi:integrase